MARRTRRINKQMIFINVMVAALILPLIAAAQAGGGQFWVRVFEDRNGNGVRDAGEPLLTRGVAVSLLNSDRIVIATALLDESPNAVQGLIGFQFLAPGEYTLVVTSPELSPTTPAEFTREIAEGAVPTVVEYGGARIDLNAVEGSAESQAALTGERGLFGTDLVLGERDQVARVALALLGAFVVAGLMLLLGLIVYLLVLRPRHRAELQRLKLTTTTGSLEAVDVSRFQRPR